ncbi:heat shock 70 kDa 17 [Olea europaea subsp. europaea]|uniref:Heat shock 70 kDa 17 n=1 Tax=Olea europaea subsp. europaea TaxID=158383 RepID=A0A8S0RSB2_OLEEU|nr:heat shock 70 kDa 17 [Olea europaea subsp. europaea]
MFYDMGANSSYAALVYFSAYNAKEFGKTTSVNQFQVKDVRWDAELGGQNMEHRLVEYFADEFNKQIGNGVNIRNIVDAMAKLKKQIKRTKEILSANTMAPISVESLYDHCDFSTISREKFEELCEDLWDKSFVPVMEVLKHSCLKADDLYAVELIGSSTRAKLLELLGRKDLDKHLDADEAIVLGASLHVANLSDGIKLNRKLGMIDGSTYGFLIVLRMKKFFTALQMFRSIIYDNDFEVLLAYESEDFMPPGASSLTFSQYAISGLTDSSENRSSVFFLDGADAVVEITEWVEVPQKNVTVGNLTPASSNGIEAGLKSSSEESSDKLEMNDSTSNASISSVTDSATSDIVIEKKLKKRTFRLPLKALTIAQYSGCLYDLR